MLQSLAQADRRPAFTIGAVGSRSGAASISSVAKLWKSPDEYGQDPVKISRFRRRGCRGRSRNGGGLPFWRAIGVRDFVSEGHNELVGLRVLDQGRARRVVDIGLAGGILDDALLDPVIAQSDGQPLRDHRH